MRIRLYLLILPLLLPATSAIAQPAGAGQAPDGWSLGVATIYREGTMLGEDTRTLLVPTFGYEGERFFLRGISGGVHLWQQDGWSLDATLSARLDGWDAEDLDAVALAARGIDRALLEDRNFGLDAGLGVQWRGRAGVLGASVKADVSGNSEGFEALLEYGYPLSLAGGRLTPTLQVAWWSDNLTDYYYGTLPSEEAAGVPSYRPGDALVPAIGVRWIRRFAQRWIFVAGVQHQWLDDAINDSPLVDDSAEDGQGSLFLGISRRFGGG